MPISSMKIVWEKPWWGKIKCNVFTTGPNDEKGCITESGLRKILENSNVSICNALGPEALATAILNHFTAPRNGRRYLGVAPGIMTSRHKEITLFFENITRNNSSEG